MVVCGSWRAHPGGRRMGRQRRLGVRVVPRRRGTYQPFLTHKAGGADAYKCDHGGRSGGSTARQPTGRRRLGWSQEGPTQRSGSCTSRWIPRAGCSRSHEPPTTLSCAPRPPRSPRPRSRAARSSPTSWQPTPPGSRRPKPRLTATSRVIEAPEDHPMTDEEQPAPLPFAAPGEETDAGAYIGNQPERQAETTPGGITDREERASVNDSRPGVPGEAEADDDTEAPTGPLTTKALARHAPDTPEGGSGRHAPEGGSGRRPRPPSRRSRGDELDRGHRRLAVRAGGHRSASGPDRASTPPSIRAYRADARGPGGTPR